MALAVSVLGAGAAWLNWVVAKWHAGPSRKEEEEARAWDYEKMKALVADVRLPAMVVDLDVLDANTRYIWESIGTSIGNLGNGRNEHRKGPWKVRESIGKSIGKCEVA